MEERVLKRIEALEKKIDHLEFQFKLAQENTNVSQLLIDYNITNTEYEEIMNIMDYVEDKIQKGETISHHTFEQKIYSIHGTVKNGDYHFCEYLAKAFFKDESWDSVFPYLYGHMPKYKNYMKTDNK